MTETRNILDVDENVIGTLSLPDNTPEPIWTEKLNVYKQPPFNPGPEPGLANKTLLDMEFGRKVISDACAKNTVLELTLAQIKNMISRTDKVQQALLVGALHVAIDELGAIDPDPIILPAVRITAVRNKIQAYLGLPLT